MKSSVGTKLHKQMARFVFSYSNRRNECNMNECIFYATIVSEVRLQTIRTSTTGYFSTRRKAPS